MESVDSQIQFGLGLERSDYRHGSKPNRLGMKYADGQFERCADLLRGFRRRRSRAAIAAFLVACGTTPLPKLAGRRRSALDRSQVALVRGRRARVRR